VLNPVNEESDSGESISDYSGGDSSGIQEGDSDGATGSLPYEDPDESLNSQNGFEINGENKNILSFLLPDIKQVDVLDAMFFTATVSPAGKVIDTNVSRIMESSSYAANMARSLYQEHKTRGWLEKCKYLMVEDETGNHVYIFLHRDRDLENRFRVMRFTLIISLLFLAIVYGIVWFVSRQMLVPLSENIEKQKSFVTNASHELKTPLAIIQTNAEALELYNGKNKWTSNIIEQIGRLSIMLNNMLTLSRADEGAIQNAQEEVDLTAVTEELLGMYVELANAKSITIFQHIEDSLPVRSNRTQMVQLLTILLDNAVKYAMEGTTLEVHIYSRERNTFFETVNRCSQLPECEPDRLFERFYRPDSSRYSDKPGNGIGLSAARAIVHAYGGLISCKYEGKDFIRFTVVFHR